MVKHLTFIFLFLFQLNLFSSIDLGELHRQNTPQVIAIHISSPNQHIQESATNAFRLHGGFKLADPKNANYSTKITQTGTKSVEIALYKRNTNRLIYSASAHGSTLTNATLKACDLIVLQTSRTPGFFAGKIAFVGERDLKDKQIYTSDLLFSEIKQLTHEKEDSITPHFSPDGSKIIYTGYYKGNFPELFLIDLHSGQRKSFAAFKGTNMGGAFNPSGNKVAMTISAREGGIELYVSDNQGKRPKRITRDKALITSPSWSPKGNQLVYASDIKGVNQLYTIDLFSNRITRLHTKISRYCAEPAWNPEHSNLIAFTAANSKSFQVTLFDLKTQKSQIITKPPTNHQEPEWLNDGRHLLCTVKSETKRKLHILDTHTGRLTALAPRFGNTSQASFVY